MTTAHPITRDQWLAECKHLAKEIKAEHDEYGTDLNDMLHQAVDGHEWISYTYRARQVTHVLTAAEEIDAFDGLQGVCAFAPNPDRPDERMTLDRLHTLLSYEAMRLRVTRELLELGADV